MAQIVFLSDAHLGSGADSEQRERELCHFLDSVKADCEQLFLLGDMFDFWFSYRHVVPRGHVRLLGKLAEMADRGIAIHYFIGNHDMWLFDYLRQEIGATMYEEPTLFTLDGRRFLIGHGDGLGHLDRKFDVLRRIFRSPLNQRLFADLPSSWTFPIARRWSDRNKLRHAHEDSMHYLGDEREGIVIYCREQLRHTELDYCVFGHRHTPLVMPLSERCTYINTGNWLSDRNYAIYSTTDHIFTLYDLPTGAIGRCP